MRYLMLAVAAIVATGMVACGKKNDSVANPNLWQNSCPVGYYNYGGVCRIAPGGGYYGYSSIRAGGSLNAVGSQAFAQLLGQYGRFCVNNGWNNWPGQFNYNLAIGSYNCNQYSQAGYVKLIFDASGTRAQVIIGSGTNNGLSPYEVVLNGRVYPINNSQGMEIRANGNSYSGGWNAVYDQGLVIIVQQGTPQSTQYDATLTYRGQNLGDARIYRY
jgi:hypothetical protein